MADDQKKALALLAANVEVTRSIIVGISRALPSVRKAVVNGLDSILEDLPEHRTPQEAWALEIAIEDWRKRLTG